MPSAFRATEVIRQPVRTSGSDQPAGITLLLVDARDAGITREPLENIGGYPLDALTFADVRVPAANAVGAPDRGATDDDAVDTNGRHADFLEAELRSEPR